MSNLTPTAKVILGFLRLGARTGYDIKRVTELSVQLFWGASYGQIYPELRRLEEVGLVRSKPLEGARKRREYRLTSLGERALHEWLTDADELLFDYRDEALLKLFFGELLTRAEVLTTVRARREWIRRSLDMFRGEIEPRARDGVAEGEELPYLVYRYGVGFLEWMDRWYRRAERELSELGSELDLDDAGSGETRLGAS
jgi:DNA-binding PadR family transcriptional regulator